MWNKTLSKTKLMILICSFCGAFLVGRHSVDSSIDEDSKHRFTEISTSEKNVFLRNSERKRFSEFHESENKNIISFMQKLKNSSEINVLNELLSESFEKNDYKWHLDIMRYSVIQKWGEVAPKQGLEKLENIDGGKEFIHALFIGWAGKNPEAAMAFYEEHYLTNPASSAILGAIISEYAKQTPQKAWDWLQSHENNVPSHILGKGKNSFFLSAFQQHPELIPEFVKNTKESEYENAVYTMALNWGQHDAKSREWIDYLPKEIKNKAEAGRIMGISQGNLNQVKEEISSIDASDQMEVTKQLSYHVLDFGGFDMQARVEWILDSLPESEIPENLKIKMGSWLAEDVIDGKMWIDSLPAGKKKSFLQNCYDLMHGAGANTE